MAIVWLCVSTEIFTQLIIFLFIESLRENQWGVEHVGMTVATFLELNFNLTRAQSRSICHVHGRFTSAS